MKRFVLVFLLILYQSANAEEMYQPKWDTKNSWDSNDAWLFENVEIIEVLDPQDLIERYSQLPVKFCADIYSSKKKREAAKCDARQGGIPIAALLEDKKQGEFESNLEFEKRKLDKRIQIELAQKKMLEKRVSTLFRLQFSGIYQKDFDTGTMCFESPYRKEFTEVEFENSYYKKGIIVDFTGGGFKGGGLSSLGNISAKGEMEIHQGKTCFETSEQAESFDKKASQDEIKFVIYFFPTKDEKSGQGNLLAFGYVFLNGEIVSYPEEQRPQFTPLSKRYSSETNGDIRISPR